MDIIVTLLVVAVIFGLVYWAASVIPFPAQLAFFRWLLPVLALVAALIWAWPKLGIS